ncbi:MAG: hypothetical protein ACK50A_02425 [Sphingobacteriaceae bacterium]|jgi:L-cystine uptake protein TcyP (sodium:dicarboxylate symporter family)
MNSTLKITKKFLTSLCAVVILVSVLFSTSISSLVKIELLNGIELTNYMLEEENKKDTDENENDPIKELNDLTLAKNDHAFSCMNATSVNRWINSFSYNQSILIDIPFPPPKV